MRTDSYSGQPVQRRTRRSRRTPRNQARVLEAITLELIQLGEMVIYIARGEQAYLWGVGGQKFWTPGPVVYRTIEAIDDIEQPKLWSPTPRPWFGGNFLLCRRANPDEGFKCASCQFVVPFLYGGVTGSLMCKECLVTEGADPRAVRSAPSIVLVTGGRRYRLSAVPTLQRPGTTYVDNEQAVVGHG
jgi:hypothetical protein